MGVGVLLVRVRVGGVDGRRGGEVPAHAAPAAHADAAHDGADVVARPAAAVVVVVGPIQLVRRASVGTGAAVA